MYKITNKTPHPYDIHTKDGVKVIAAFGTLEAEFDPAYLEMIKLSFEVEEETEDESAADQEEEVEESAQEEAEEQRLEPKAEYEALTGKKPDGRWSEERIISEIAKIRG